MVFTIILLILMAIVFVLLFTPFVLRIDTRTDLYRAQWGLASAALNVQGDQVCYRVQVPFWKREGTLMDLLRQEQVGPPGLHTRALAEDEQRPHRGRLPVRALLRSFRVRHFHWSLDTGDPMWNAWLFPVFQMLRVHGRDLSISFIGRNEFALTVDNNLYRLLKAVLLNQRPTIKHQRT